MKTWKTDYASLKSDCRLKYKNSHISVLLCTSVTRKGEMAWRLSVKQYYRMIFKAERLQRIVTTVERLKTQMVL